MAHKKGLGKLAKRNATLRQIEAVKLHHSGLSVEAIAESLDVSVSTVKNYLRRASKEAEAERREIVALYTTEVIEVAVDAVLTTKARFDRGKATVKDLSLAIGAYANVARLISGSRSEIPTNAPRTVHITYNNMGAPVKTDAEEAFNGEYYVVEELPDGKGTAEDKP